MTRKSVRHPPLLICCERKREDGEQAASSEREGAERRQGGPAGGSVGLARIPVASKKLLSGGDAVPGEGHDVSTDETEGKRTKQTKTEYLWKVEKWRENPAASSLLLF